jgi:hypothetical protein
MEIGYNVCDNYKIENDYQNLNIGFSQSSGALFIVIPSISIVTNICVIIAYYRKRQILNKKQ